MSDERKDLPPVTAANFLEKVREALSVYLGNRGNALDRGVTLRDLIDAGMVVLRPGYLTNGGGKPIAGATAAPGGTTTGGTVYEADLTPPPTPSSFVVSAAISHVFVGHGAPLYTQGHGHAKTVVYGATWQTGSTYASGGSTPVFSDAVVLTEFSGVVFAYPSNPATTWHLWIKWVTVDGVASLHASGL